MRVGVVGLGYIGLPLAVALTAAGHRVVGLDTDPSRLRDIEAGTSPVEGVSDDGLAQARRDGLVVTNRAEQLAGSTAIVICVPTPLTSDGVPDTAHIAAAVDSLAAAVERGTLVVLESTSYPGTTQEIVAERLERLTGMSAETDFCVAFSPERIDPGNQTFDIANTPRIVAGLRECCRDRAVELYSTVASKVVPASGLREAELAKLIENTYRQVNIALVNELARFAHLMGIDLREAIRCAATKPFGFQAFTPGPGVGGHCIPIDPRLLASRIESELGATFRFVELAQEINSSMPKYVIERVEKELNRVGIELTNAHVALFGVAYKANVSDVRASPAVDVVRELRARGAAVSFVDPHVAAFDVDNCPVERASSMDAGRWDAAVLLQPHREYETYDLSGLATVVVDCTGTLVGEHVAHL